VASRLDIIRSRVTDMLRELQTVREDTETMSMVGILAGRILMDAKQPHWAQMKRRLTAAAYDQLLLTAQIQGNDLFGEGNIKAAFALDIIATSIVASRVEDPRLVEGVALLDEIIERAVTAWRKSNAPTVN
jgi:hypothetical protein